jgi:hypothetical protein
VPCGRCSADLEVGELFCAALAETYAALVSFRPEWRTELDDLCARLGTYTRSASESEEFDPLGGDVGTREEKLELLRSVASRLG